MNSLSQYSNSPIVDVIDQIDSFDFAGAVDDPIVPLNYDDVDKNSIVSSHTLSKGHNIPFLFSDDIGKKDVLCGREKFSFGHCGNKRFRVVIDMHRDRYQNTTLKEEKTQIIMDIIRLIEESGGRFLKRSEDYHDCWCVAGFQCSREKVSHALRSNKHRKRKTTKPNQTMFKKLDTPFKDVLRFQQNLFCTLMNP